MRDRFPISQTDPLSGAAGRQESIKADGRGKHVKVNGYNNLALIRSGQDWSATTGKERDLYLKQIQPTLISGMTFLRDSGVEIGCLSCRYMYQTDENWSPAEKTFGLAHFDNLRNLELWAVAAPCN
jgi:aldoxime dehydratase